VLCQAQQRDNNTNEVGQCRQCHSGDIHQQARGDALPAALSACTVGLGLVHTEECVSGCRTPTRERQYNSRSGITINKGLLRLDAEPPVDTTANGSTTDRSICTLTHEATAEFLQLETRSGSDCDRCVQPRLGSNEGICQPSMVLDSMMPKSDKWQEW